MGQCYVTEVILGALLCLTSAASRQAPKQVWVVTGGRADLPCPHTPKHAHDQPILVLWYRSSDTLPIYSYDARSGDFTLGVRWADEKALGVRAFFTTASDPPMLVLEPAHAYDQGVYTCRVDFRVSSSSTAVVNLTVVIPAGQPTIYWKEHVMVDAVGPLKQDSTAKLTCRSAGGRPPPDLTWWDGDRQLPTSSSKSVSDPSTDTYWSQATVTVRAHRALQGMVFSCQALTPTDEQAHQRVACQPKVSHVTMNITLPPLDVAILGPEEVTVSAGTMVTLTCRALGSHPPAKLTWWRGHVPLRHHVTNAVSSDRNVSTAALTIKINKSQNGANLACIANNPAIPHKSVTRTIKLEVHYMPVVNLTLGQPLEANNIKEGDDVYFECSIVANPKYLRVDWYHDDVPVEHNVSVGVVVSGLSLVMRRLSPFHSGSYSCGAANQEGYSKSNPVVLTVRHAPVCIGNVMERVQGASRGALTVIRCKILAEPSRNISWAWVRMRTDGTEEEVANDRIQNNGLSSSVLVTPLRQEDYGRFMCRATNAVGMQKRPCVVNLVPAGPPDMPSNCSAEPIRPELKSLVKRDGGLNILPDLKRPVKRDGGLDIRAGAEEEVHDAALAISCMVGFDGGLPQYFMLEAWQENVLVANVTREVPIWFVSGLKAGVGVTLKIAALNPRGRSDVIRMQVHTASAEHRADPSESDPALFGIPPLLGGVVGVGGVLLLLLITGAIVAKYARPRRTPTHVHTLVMTPTDKSSGKKAGIFDPDVVTSLRRHTDSLDVLPRTAATQRSTATQVPGQRQAFIQTNAHGHTVTRAYVHKPSTKQTSLSRGFCIRRQESPFSDSDADDSDESDSDSTFTDLTAAGRAASRVPPAECRSNSFPRTNSRNIRHISTAYDSQIRCCQRPQLLSSSEGRLHQLSCMQAPASSSSRVHHITTSAGELHQILSSTGELQHLITTSGGLQHLTSRGAIHQLTSTTGTLQHLTSTSKELKHLPTTSHLHQHIIPSTQEPQYPRSSSLDGLHTFVFSEELQRFLTSRELCQISFSEKCFPFAPATTIWGSINNSRDSMPIQVHSGNLSTSQQTLSSTVSMQPLSSQQTMSSTVSVQPASLDVDPPASFTELGQAVSNINLHSESSLHGPYTFKRIQTNYSNQDLISQEPPEHLLLNETQDLQQVNLSAQDCLPDESFLCGKLLPPPSFREPHQKSPTEEIPFTTSPERSQPFTLFSSMPNSTPGPIQQSASFSGFNQHKPVSIELQSFHASKSLLPVTSETTSVNGRLASSSSCGEFKSVLGEFQASKINNPPSNLVSEPSEKLQKLFDSSKEIKKSSPSSILRSPKSSFKKSFNQCVNGKTASLPRPTASKVNKPTVRFCDTLVTGGIRNKCPEELLASGTGESRGKTKQVSFAETDSEDRVLVRKNSKADGAKSSTKRCAQLFSTEECDFVSAIPYAESSRTTKESEMLDAALRDLLSGNKSHTVFSSCEDARATSHNPSTPTKPPRGMNPIDSFTTENTQNSPKPSLFNYSKEKKDSSDVSRNLSS